MSAKLAQGKVTIKIVGELVSNPYLDITLHIMEQFGVQVINHDYQEFVIPAGRSYVSLGCSSSRVMPLLLPISLLRPPLKAVR